MTSEDSKCGDDCKLVEMLASKTSKEQAMENAEALYLADPGNISIRGAAKQCGVDHTALSRRINKKQASNMLQEQHVTADLEAAPGKQRIAENAERDQWWTDYQADLSLVKIAKKYNRGRNTITAEIRRREKAQDQSEPTPTPTPTRSPAATATTASTKTDSTKEIKIFTNY